MQVDDEDGEASDMILCIARAFGLLHNYEGKEALEELELLEPHQRNTPAVLAMIGRAHFEMADYKAAEESFKAARAIDPFCPEALDSYSTTLWHLKKELELSYLAKESVQDNRLCPQAWCVVGNCFSLQRDHDTAIKFFNRAVQLDPNYSIGYTLCGHEHSANEDYDRALACFRNAIRTDERNYKAWFGLGNVYQRQEKFEMAEYHFKRAIEINPHSSVLHCWLGIVLDERIERENHEDRLEQLELPLAELQKAITLDPNNPIARFKHAKVLMALSRDEEAVEELVGLLESAPKEAEILLQLGRAYKKLGDPQKAMLQFMMAWDLDPRNSNHIKSEMEKLENPTMMEDGHDEL